MPRKTRRQFARKGNSFHRHPARIKPEKIKARRFRSKTKKVGSSGSHTFMQDLVNSLVLPAAVLDEKGEVQAVNEGWKQFTCNSWARGPWAAKERMNLLELSRCSQSEVVEMADELLNGIQAVLERRQTNFLFEQSTGFGEGECWYRMQVTPLSGRRGGAIVVCEDITGRKRTEQSLRSILESSASISIISTDVDGNILFWNKGAENLFGYSAEEVVGRMNMDAFYPDDETKVTIQQIRRDIAREGRPLSRRLAESRKDGSIVWVDVTVSPRLDRHGNVIGMLGIGHDVTGRVMAELAGKEAEKKIRLLAQTVASSRDSVCVMDLEGKILFVNDAFLNLHGFEEKEVLGQGIAIVYSPHTPLETFAKIIAATLAGNWHGEVLACKKDGSEFPLELWTSLLKNDEGKPVATVGVARDITQRKETERVLREKEERFRSLIENTSDIICVLEADGSIRYASPSVERILGYQPHELIRGNAFDLVHLDDATHVKESFARALSNPGVTYTDVELRSLHKDGSWHILEAVGKCLIEESQEKSIVLNLRDITERRRAEQVQAAVYRISEAAQISQNLDELFSSIHAIIADFMPAENFYIGLYNPSTGLFHFPYHADEIEDEWLPMRPGKSLTGFVLRTGRPLLATPEVFEQLAQSGEVALVGTPSVDWLGVPLKTQQGETIGVMGVQTYTETVRLRETDKDVLMFVSTQVAMAIERKQTVDALTASEERYRLLFHQSPVGIFHYDSQLRITDFNDQFVSLLQSKREYLAGLDMNQLRDRRVLPAIRQAIAGVEGRYEGEYAATTSAAQIWVSMKTAPVFDKSGHARGGIGIVEDVTERKLAEEALTNSERRYRSLFEDSLDTVYISTVEGRLVDINPAGVKLFGYTSKEELLGTEISRDLYVDSGDWTSLVEALAESGFVREAEVALKRKDGSRIRATISATGVKEAAGKVAYMRGFIHDITERKKAEEQILTSLREKELLLKEIHHRVKNNMQVVSSLLNLQAHRIPEGREREIFRESMRRVRSMALVHEQLYRSENMANIDFGDYLRKVTRELLRTYGGEGVSCSVEADPIHLGVDTAIPCGLMVNELVTNSLKHAFQDRKTGNVIASIHRRDDKKIELAVQDDGIGFPEEIDFLTISSMGMTLVVALAEQISGTIAVERIGGTKFSIVFPG